jgi:hypothetical protein
MSRREERRELAEELLERKEALDGALAQASELAKPEPPPKRPRGRPPSPSTVAKRLEQSEAAREAAQALLARRQAELAALDAARPSTPPPEPAPVLREPSEPPPPMPRPAASPPNPQPQPTSRTMSIKDPGKHYHAEPPYEAMNKNIEEGFGPDVWAEVRRLLPGGTSTTIKKNILLPIAAWNQLGERFSTLLSGGGSLILRLSQEKNGSAFISWKESFEGPPRQVDPSLTLCYDPDDQQFKITQNGLEAMGGMPFASSPPNPYAAPLPPVPAGYAAASAPPFPRPSTDPAGRLLPPPDSAVPPWARTFPAEQQWAVARDVYKQQHGIDPTQVAMQWVGQQGREVEHARTQAARYEERLDATKDRATAALDAERVARASLERQVAEMRAQMLAKDQQAAAEKRETELRNEMKLLELKIANGNGSSSPGASVQQFAALATALAPVVTAYISSERQRALAEQQSRDEFNRTLLLAMTQQNKGPDIVGLLGAASPILAPVLVRWLENQDPEKLDTARHNADQRNLMMMKFVFDNIQAQMGGSGEEPEPWWLKFLKEVAPQVMGLGQIAMLEAGRRADRNARELPASPAEPPPPRPGETQVIDPSTPLAPQPEPVAPPPPTTSFALDITQTVMRFSEADPEAAQMLGFILTELAKTPGAEAFLRHEWAAVLFHLHVKPKSDQDLEDRAETTAVMLADLLEHDRQFGLLPQSISHVFVSPRDALMPILMALPVYSLDHKYATRFLELFVEEITMREKNRTEAENESEEDEDEQEETEVGSELATVAAE